MKLPIEPYQLGGYKFGELIWRRGFVPAVHLGQDVRAGSGEVVRACAAGKAMLARTLPGSEQKKTWGGLVVLQHNSNLQTFYSLYGHLKNLRVKEGERISEGQVLGEVAGAQTAENGWWQKEHMHFAIYAGPWRNEILPGWWRMEEFWRTKIKWWREPASFIEDYQRGK